MVRRKGLDKSRFGSVQPSPAALIRAAFHCSSLCRDIKIIRTQQSGSDYSSVLGTEVQILFRKESEDSKLSSMVGYYDCSKSLIVIKIIEPNENSLGDLEKYQKEVLRHEIIHAFLHESGVDTCSAPCECWATNEEMVDWFAIQSPKIFRLFKEEGLL